MRKLSYPKDIGVIATVFIFLIFLLAIINLYISIQFRSIYLEADKARVVSVANLLANYWGKESDENHLNALYKNIAKSFNLKHLCIADSCGDIVYDSWTIPGFRATKNLHTYFKDFQLTIKGETAQKEGAYIYYNSYPSFYLYISDGLSSFDPLFRWHLFYITVSLILIGGLGFLLLRNLFLPMHYTARIAQQLGIEMEKEDFVPTTFQEVSKRIKLKEDELHQFAAYVAHEFRNSIGAIIGLARLIEKGKKKASDIIKECQTMEDLITNLINYSRPLTPSFSNLNLEELIDEAIQRMKFPRRIKIKKTIQPGLPSLSGDYELILHTLTNLLKNSLDAIPKNGVIEITGLKKDDRICIGVADTGEGIGEKDLDKVFSPFYTKKEKGAGLGLAYVKKVMELHHGRVEFESKKGKGSKFTLTFPIYH